MKNHLSPAPITATNPPTPQQKRRSISDTFIILFAILVLLISMPYAFSYVFLVPYPGFSFDTDLRITDVDRCLNNDKDQCLQPGDQIRQIGNLSFKEYQSDRTSIPLSEIKNHQVQITVSRNGTEKTILWQTPDSLDLAWAFALLGTITVLPFWLSGTLIALFLRPRDARWRLLVIFNYLMAIWLAAGIAAPTHVGFSAYLARISGWLLIPLLIHVHIILPAEPRWFPKQFKIGWLYMPFFLLALTEFQAIPLPSDYHLAGLMLSLIISVVIFITRLFDRSLKSNWLAARLMFTGIGLAFGPALIWLVQNTILEQIDPSSTGSSAFGYIGIPLLPFFYTYAAYRHRLGNLEFRANRLLSAYSFASLYIVAIVFTISILAGILHINGLLPFSLFAVTIVFSIAAPTLRTRFQRVVDRLAYGTSTNPDELIRLFADQIPRAITRTDLEKLLATEIMPSLLIRQYALFVMSCKTDSIAQTQALEIVFQAKTTLPPNVTKNDLSQLLAQAEQFRLEEIYASGATWDWVRLAITFPIDDTRDGIWLLGERDPDNFYPQKDISLLKTLAAQIGVALRTADLLQESRRYAQDLQTLHRVSADIVSTLYPKETYRRTVQALQDAFGYEKVSFYVLARDKFFLETQVGYEKDELVDTIEITSGVIGRSLRLRQTQLVLDARSDPDFFSESPNIVSEIATPIQIGDQVLGVLNIESTRLGSLTEKDRDLLLVLANQVAVAITNAHSYETATRQLRQFKALREISLQMASSLDLGNVLNTIAKATMDLLAPNDIHIFLYDQTAEKFTFGSALWKDGRHSSLTVTQNPDELSMQVIKTANPVFIDDANQNPLYQLVPMDETQQPTAIAGLPMKRAGNVLGVFNVAFTDRRTIEPDHRELLSLLADQAALTVDNARLFEETTRRAEKLAVAYEDLKKLDRMKDEFVQTVSHELRTPLTFVRGYVELVLEEILGELNTQQREALSIVADRTVSTIHLVDDIISLQQSEVQAISRDPVNLGDVATMCVQSAQATAQNEKATLTLEVQPDLPIIFGDVDRLRQVFDNLIGNAIKFSPDGGQIQVKIYATEHAFYGGSVEPAVAADVIDHGIGIAANQIGRVWDRFYQVDSTKTRRFGGTGLGLAIVKRIVESHGGVVGLESTVGEGSTFKFVIPISVDNIVDKEDPLL